MISKFNNIVLFYEQIREDVPTRNEQPHKNKVFNSVKQFYLFVNMFHSRSVEQYEIRLVKHWVVIIELRDTKEI